MTQRPPIIVVMGHVDHGKTTLLDHIRKTSVAEREAGGITQSIGAYEISHNGKRLTFIDTPGHAAFSEMRSRGANIADVAILIVAADDGVKPQTKEAFACIESAKIPFIVAINKIDTPGANVEKTKNELMQAGIYLEGAGGDVSWQAISAKKGDGVSELLDLIILATEMENLECNENASASGVIITSHLDPRRGIIAGIVLKNGTLRKGNLIATQTAEGKVKLIEVSSTQKPDEITPCTPALISGFNTLPRVGEEFFSGEVHFMEEIRSTLDALREPQREFMMCSAENPESAELTLLLKADEMGSLEALQGVIEKLAKEIPMHVIDANVGNITERDVKLAAPSHATVIGFRTKIDKAAENLAKGQHVNILQSQIIYKLEEEIVACHAKTKSKEGGRMEVLAVFGEAKGVEQIIGGKIISGVVKNQSEFEIFFKEKSLGTGKIKNLQSGKVDVQEALEEQEVGMLVQSETPIKKGYIISFFG